MPIKYIMGLVLLLVLASFGADADTTVYGGALTYHFDRDTDYNETNFLLAVEKDQFIIGGFDNSYYNPTYMVGYHKYIERDNLQLGWLLGAMYGYENNQTIMPCVNKYCLMAAPVFKYTEYAVQPTIIFGGNFVSLAIGYKF